MTNPFRHWTKEDVEAHQARIHKRATGQIVHSGEDGKDIVSLPTPPKVAKYGNRKCEVDGEKFDSEKEARLWQQRRMQQEAGEIKDLRRQVIFHLVVNGIEVCAYVADFVYVREGTKIVEDVKGYKRGAAYQMFRLKKKLMWALHRLDVKEL